MRGVLVKQRKLSEDVAAHLERMIREGELTEADRLPSERELMQHFGVGRPSIREALLRLSKMGLVEVRSGERARVTRPTPQFVIDALSGTARHMISAPGGIHDFQNARLFFEVGLARNAALTATESDISNLSEALEANRRSLGDLRAFEKTDVDFHYVLAVMTHNPIFMAIHAALAEWLLEQRRTTLADGDRRESLRGASADLRGDRGARSRQGGKRDAPASAVCRPSLHRTGGEAVMSGFVVIVDFRLKPGSRSAFRRLVDTNATASVRDEPGCRRFDVLEVQGESRPGAALRDL